MRFCDENRCVGRCLNGEFFDNAKNRLIGFSPLLLLNVFLYSLFILTVFVFNLGFFSSNLLQDNFFQIVSHKLFEIFKIKITKYFLFIVSFLFTNTICMKTFLLVRILLWQTNVFIYTQKLFQFDFGGIKFYQFSWTNSKVLSIRELH